MSGKGPNSRELVTKAQYFLPIPTEEKRLRAIQNKLARIMEQNGYQQTDYDPIMSSPAPRTMDFIFLPPAPEKSWFEKLIAKLRFNNGSKREGTGHDEFLEGLERLRDDIPFRINFRFKTFEGEDNEGYDVFIESTPVLLQKYRQLDLPEDYSYDKEDIIDQNSREIQQIMGKLELEPLRGPYTEEQRLDTKLSEEIISELDRHQYGRTAVQFINEGDQCYKQNLLHAALSCYILGIEWLIIWHKSVIDEVDLVEEQKNNDCGPVFFSDLVDELEGTAASQKTISKLRNFNSAERRWIAHHKFGETKQDDVDNVRSTVLRLAKELNQEVAEHP